MEKINKLKKILKKVDIDGYLITKNDEFFGEYIQDNKDRLKYITNFTGSYGFALILTNANYLFVDGRYTLQARIESGKNFIIKDIPRQIPIKIKKRREIKIGFDPKLITYEALRFIFKNNSFKFVPFKKNLVDQIWTRKNYSSNKSFFWLSKKFTGQSNEQKLSKVYKNLKKRRVDFQFISASENNAWLFNIRGKDSNYSPIPNSYSLVGRKKRIYFFCDVNKITSSIKKKYKNLRFIRIEDTEKILSKIKNKKFIIDSKTCSIFYENIILKNNKILNRTDPVYFLKSIKTKKEIANMKRAHVLDGAALTKYLFWVKNNFSKKKITELSGEKKLLNYRKKNKEFKFLSFPTISGVGPNGAIIHYRANKKTNKKLLDGKIYLVDSGGQYEFGTTDVTRTISLNNKNERIKNIFTRVLKGHIAVANFKLNKNTSGSEIDKVARKHLKKINLNYSHGTGHGVGFFLNVHEGPQAITKNNYVPFKEGMVVSNEPGYYENNKFGMRIENLIYVKKRNNKLVFDNLTMAPIDKSLINIEILKNNEITWINTYHKKVYKSLKNFMNNNEKGELKKACSAI